MILSFLVFWQESGRGSQDNALVTDAAGNGVSQGIMEDCMSVVLLVLGHCFVSKESQIYHSHRSAINMSPLHPSVTTLIYIGHMEITFVIFEEDSVLFNFYILLV